LSSFVMTSSISPEDVVVAGIAFDDGLCWQLFNMNVSSVESIINKFARGKSIVTFLQARTPVLIGVDSYNYFRIGIEPYTIAAGSNRTHAKAFGAKIHRKSN
jgi:hypothetical protein